MVIDTSALIAILTNEPESPAIARAIERDPRRLVSAASLLEASIVLVARHGEAATVFLDDLLHEADAEIVPVTEDHARRARSAYLRFGKGRHPAGLNFGDCLVYALAEASGEPLLFKGADFAQTDLALVPVGSSTSS